MGDSSSVYHSQGVMKLLQQVSEKAQKVATWRTVIDADTIAGYLEFLREIRVRKWERIVETWPLLS